MGNILITKYIKDRLSTDQKFAFQPTYHTRKCEIVTREEENFISIPLYDLYKIDKGNLVKQCLFCIDPSLEASVFQLATEDDAAFIEFHNNEQEGFGQQDYDEHLREHNAAWMKQMEEMVNAYYEDTKNYNGESQTH